MKKYGIIIICSEDENNIYVDNILKLFDTLEQAKEELSKAIWNECNSLNEDTDSSVLYTLANEEIWYQIDNNGVYIPSHIVSKYQIVEFN